MATVVALVDRGASVLLATTEATGPHVGAVGDRRSAGRRLARAVAEPDARGRRRLGHDGADDERPRRRPSGPTGPGLPSTRSPCAWPVPARWSPASPPAGPRASCRGRWRGGSIALVVVGHGPRLPDRASARCRGSSPSWPSAAVAAFVWFFRQLTGQAIYDVSTVENPLAVLFVWVQVAHAFDVPARRDLAFSLAGSASLMAVAAAQAIDLGFGVYVLVWLGVRAGGAAWPCGARPARAGASAAGGAARHLGGGGRHRRPWCSPSCPPRTWRAGSTSPPTPGPAAPLPVPGGLAGDGQGGAAGQAGQPGRRARAWVATWASPTASTPPCAARSATPWSCGCAPSGRRTGSARPSTTGTAPSWTRARRRTARSASTTGSPFILPGAAPPARRRRQTDLQTFYVVQPSPNLVFHADTAARGVVPGPRPLRLRRTTPSSRPSASGPGAIYTVESDVDTPTAAAAARPRRRRARHRRRPLAAHDTELPHPYPRVEALAERSRPRSADTYDKVESLIAWIGAHTHYSTDIPPLAPGQDTVDEFLFGNRTGFCEQISTSLAVMLRSIGIPAREAVGLRARALQPHHRPLRRPGQGRPRLGPGVVPRATAGRASTPPPWSPWPTRRRGPRSSRRRRRAGAGSRGSPIGARPRPGRRP